MKIAIDKQLVEAAISELILAQIEGHFPVRQDVIDKLAEALDRPSNDVFNKILKCKDGGTWHLTDKEVEEWEKDGSIKSGDILYRIVETSIY